MSSSSSSYSVEQEREDSPRVKRIRFEEPVPSTPTITSNPWITLSSEERREDDGVNTYVTERRLNTATGVTAIWTQVITKIDPESGRALLEGPGRTQGEYHILHEDNGLHMMTKQMISKNDPTKHVHITVFNMVNETKPVPAPAPLGAGAGAGGGPALPEKVEVEPLIKRLPTGFIQVRILYETLEGEPVYQYYQDEEMVSCEHQGKRILVPHDFVILDDPLCTWMKVPLKSIMHPRSVYACLMAYAEKKRMLKKDPKSACEKKSIFTIPQGEQELKALMKGETRISILFEIDFIRTYIIPHTKPIVGRQSWLPKG